MRDRTRHGHDRFLNEACSLGDISKEAGGRGKEVDVMKVSEDKVHRYKLLVYTSDFTN